MRAPPPVELTWSALAPDALVRAWWWVQGLIYGAAGAAVAAWGAYAAWHALQSWVPSQGWVAWDAHRVAGLAALACGAGGMAWGWWQAKMEARRQGLLHLAWTGHEWQFQGQVVAPPRVMLDLGSWMLLKVGEKTGGQWLSLSRGLAKGCWQPLRAAIYSRA